MGWVALCLSVLSLLCGFIGWCCVRAGSRSDYDEAEIDYACEEALNRELSDISFSSASAHTEER